MKYLFAYLVPCLFVQGAMAATPDSASPAVYLCVHQFGMPGSLVPEGFYLAQQGSSKKKHRQIGEAFGRQAACEQEAEKINSEKLDLACLPASAVLAKLFGVYDLKSGQQIGRSTFEKEKCQQFATAGKEQRLVCAFSPPLGSDTFSLYSRSGSGPISDQTFSKLTDCTAAALPPAKTRTKAPDSVEISAPDAAIDAE
jgi:hypothetical protein